MLVAVLGAVCCLGVYIALFMRFVVRIDIPNHDAIYVSVGYDRTAFATANFADNSDEDMLRARGTDDEEIKKLWTYWSIAAVRLGLFLSFCGCVVAWVSAFSLGILFDQSERQSI